MKKTILAIIVFAFIVIINVIDAHGEECPISYEGSVSMILPAILKNGIIMVFYRIVRTP